MAFEPPGPRLKFPVVNPMVPLIPAVLGMKDPVRPFNPGSAEYVPSLAPPTELAIPVDPSLSLLLRDADSIASSSSLNASLSSS